MQNILDATPKSIQEKIHARMRTILNANATKTARPLLNQTIVMYEAKAPKAMGILEAGFDDAIAVLEYPEKYRRRLRTTNCLERLNEEVRRQEQVIRIFPNQNSATRLIGALLMETDDKRSGKNYLDMGDYLE